MALASAFERGFASVSSALLVCKVDSIISSGKQPTSIIESWHMTKQCSIIFSSSLILPGKSYCIRILSTAGVADWMFFF